MLTALRATKVSKSHTFLALPASYQSKKSKSSKAISPDSSLMSRSSMSKKFPLKRSYAFIGVATLCSLPFQTLAQPSPSVGAPGGPNLNIPAVDGLSLRPATNLSGSMAKGNPVDNLPKVDVDPSTTSRVQVEIEKKSSPLQTVADKTLNLKEVRIQGVESLDFQKVSALFTPLTKKEIKIKELLDAAAATTQMYKDAGYVLSFAYLPQQNFEGGVAQIVIVEGYVKDITVEGEKINNEVRITQILNLLKEEKPLTRKTFERVDGILALQPGLKVALNIPAPSTTEGGTKVEAKITQKKYDISVGAQAQKPDSQLIVSATINSLTPLGDQLTVATLLPPGEKKSKYYALNYAVPLNRYGLIGKIDISSYKERPEALSLLSQGYQSRYRNETERLAFSLSYPLILESKRNWSIGGGLYFNKEQQVYRPSPAYSAYYPDYTTSTRTSVLYAETSYAKSYDKSSHQVSLIVARGLNSMGAKTVNTDDKLDFTKVKVQAQQNFTLPKDFEVRFKGVYQHSNDKLPRSERISFGQRYYGAGYQAGEIEGDKGWGLSSELNYTWKTDYEYLKVVQPYIGYEVARASYNRPIPSVSLKSAIVGTRLSNNKNYYLDLSLAKSVGGVKPIDNSKLRYGLTYTFKY